VGKGAGLLWLLLAASHAPPPDEQCWDPSGCGVPWFAHRSSASVSCNLLKIVSFDPLKHVAPWSAPGGAWIRTWMLCEVLIKVISRRVSNSEDPNNCLIIRGNPRGDIVCCQLILDVETRVWRSVFNPFWRPFADFLREMTEVHISPTAESFHSNFFNGVSLSHEHQNTKIHVIWCSG